MSRFLISASAFALALGSFPTIGHALVPSHTLDAATLAVPAADQEVEAVEQALEPEKVTPPAPEGEMSEGGGADVEQKELKMEEPAMDLPPNE